MSQTELLPVVDEFRVLVVDDEPLIRKHLEDCLECIPRVRVDGIDNPEEIETPDIQEKDYSLIVLDVVFQDHRNAFAYLYAQVKARWPHAIVLVLSNYVNDLSDNQKKSVDIVVMKPMFRVDPQILIEELKAAIPSHLIGTTDISQEVTKSLDDIQLPKMERELHEIHGYVLRNKGPYVETVIFEKDKQGILHRRRVLLLSDLFVEDGLDEVGTPFVLRIIQKSAQTICEVDFDEHAGESATIEQAKEELLNFIEDEDERLRG
jgi:DNA-binding NarL/FixJ family response regulator